MSTWVNVGPGYRAAIYAAVFLLFFVYTAGQFDHNDFMYAVSAVFKGALYDEVHFVQAPLALYFLKVLAYLSPAGDVYAVMRVSSILLAFAALLIVAEGCISLGTAKIAFVLLGATSFFFASGAFEIGSYELPILFLACGLLVVFRKPSPLKCALLLGLFTGLAGSAKLNHILFVVPFFLFAIHHSRPHGQLLPAAGAFCVGLIAGCAPILFHVADNPASFVAHNVLYHSEWTNNFRGLDAKGSIKSVLRTLLEWLNQGGIYLLALAALGLWRSFRMSIEERVRYLVCLIGLLVAFVAAFSPAVGFKQYYVPVAFFAALCAALALQREIAESKPAGMVAALLIATIIAQQSLNIAPEAYFAARADSTMAEVRSINKKLNSSLANFDKTRCSPTVFTFAGAFVIDTGWPLSKYTEGGVFWAREKGFIPDKYMSDPKYGIERGLLYPEDLVRSSNEVNVIIVGYYDLSEKAHRVAEAELVRAAEERGFRFLTEINTRLSRTPLRVWVNPECLG